MDAAIDHSTAVITIPPKPAAQQQQPWIQTWYQTTLKKLHLASNRKRIAPINTTTASTDLVSQQDGPLPCSNNTSAQSLELQRSPSSARHPTPSKQSPGPSSPPPPAHKVLLHYARTPPASTRLLRRLARTTFTTNNNTSSLTTPEKSSGALAGHQQALGKMHRKHVGVFLKAPHFVAGGKLAGTVVMEFPAGLLQPDLLGGFESLTLQLRGVESVAEPIHFKTPTHTHEFLHRRVLRLGQHQLRICYQSYGKFVVPFAIQLPQELGGSYKDKKGSVRYQLQAELWLSWPEAIHGVERIRRRAVCKERTVSIYPNAQTRVLSEPTLYMPLNEHRRVWPSSPSKAVHLQLSLPRSIWITETPIYVHVRVDNASTRSVSDIKLELLRRQNTFSQTGLQGSFGLKPVTSTCETVAQVQASSMGWLLPIDPHMQDQATMMLQSPRDHCSIRSQKLIDVSYSIRVSLVSNTCSSADAVVELPIILVHPISLDPPPGDYEQPRESCGGQLLLNMFQTAESSSSSSSSTTHERAESPPQRTVSNSSLRSKLSMTRSLHKVRGWVQRHSPSRHRDPPLNLLSSSPTLQLQAPPTQGMPCLWQAPSEKFELVGSTSSALAVVQKYPRVGIKKRMLASSRYLKGLQNKTLSIAADGRRLLQLQDKGVKDMKPLY